MWQRFVDQHAEEMSIWSWLGAGIHDYSLMAKGLPVDVYVTEYEDEIAGLLSVRPPTFECDQVSMMFVDQEHRRRGNVHSMLSEAAHDIHGRGRLPGDSAIGNRDDLVGMLRALGFLLITYRWIVHLD